jgi:hypothetical protein
MNDSQIKAIKQAAVDGLNKAVKNWKKVGHEFRAMMDSVSNESFQVNASNIPGHPFVNENEPKVDDFVALVVDMRKSSERLKTIQKFVGIESGFQRIYYETSALLPALAQTALYNDGHVTEYLGDGLLILFQVDKDSPKKTYAEAYLAAQACVTTSRQLVNKLLSERFGLPELHIGAGLATSKALVTMVGIPTNSQAKVIGQCVWEASKLSDGYNLVHVAAGLKEIWPQSPTGNLRFQKLSKSSKHDVEGFKVSKD